MPFELLPCGMVWQHRPINTRTFDGEIMVDRVSGLYNTPAPKPPERSKSAERAERAERATNMAARMIPDLQDKVEISEEGRAAAADLVVDEEKGVPDETRRAITGNWYSAGMRMAMETLGR
ncbi:hypothetical protein GF324_00565 [bacterium]|nr:hypothetical protein [bacterium]